MREEYRDELAAAHRRIDGLQNELADERAVNASLKQEMKALRDAAPSKPKSAGSTFGLGVVTTLGGLMVFGAVTAIVARGTSHGRDVVSPPPFATPYVEHTQVSYYPQGGAGPRVVDVNGDGTEDVVWLFWDAHHEKTAVHVVALDGKDFSVLWASPGYPSQWYSERTHLIVKDRFVVMSDSKGGVHALDLDTGHERGTFNFEGGAFRLCGADNLPNVVLMNREGEGESHAFDVSTGHLAMTQTMPVCADEPPSCEMSARREGVCMGRHFDIRPKTKDVSGFLTLETNDAYLLEAHRANPREAWAVAGNRKSGEIAWEKRVAEDADVEHFGVDQWAMDANGSSLTVGYQLVSGEIKVVTRSTRDGSLLWSRVMPDTTEGSRLQSLVATNDRVYVVTNQRLHVLARKDGEPVHDVEWLTIPLEGSAASKKVLKSAQAN
jgi:outer membrane protein assembly factor BamB